MFKFSELEDIHLEITNNCQAACPMCGRNRNSGLKNPLLRLNDWTLQDFKKVMSEKVLKQIRGFFFCGNFGDPILNNDLLAMCKYAVEVNPDLNIRIHTNGSLRKPEWWKELYSVLPKKHNVVFAIDGLKDTHHLYRVNTDFDKIIENAKAFISEGGTAEWMFIRFKHNEHQTEEVKEMARQLGFKNFNLKNSSRFLLKPEVDVLDKNGNLTHLVEPPSDVPLKFIDKNIIMSYKNIMKDLDIDCYALKNKEIYIDAFKNVFPCCWLAQIPYTYIEDNEAVEVKKEMLTQYHNLVSKLGGIENINSCKKSIESIIDSTEYQTVWDEFWTTNKLITCARTCGKTNIFAKPRDQFFDRIEL